MENKPLTRVQVAATFSYVTLAAHLLGVLSTYLPYFILSGLSRFGMGGANWISGVLPLLIGFLWPFIPLLARAMAGSASDEPVTTLRDLRPLLLPCIGMIMLFGGLTTMIVTMGYVWMELRTQSSTPWTGMTSYALQGVLRCSLALALVVYPSVLDLFRPQRPL